MDIFENLDIDRERAELEHRTPQPNQWLERRISSTGLKEAKKSTRDYLHYLKKPKEKKLHFDMGNAIELYFIDREEFNRKVIVMDESKRPFPDKNYQTKANQEWKANFYTENTDKYIIPAKGKDSMEIIEILSNLAIEHPLFHTLYEGMNYQDPFEWICPKTGLSRYARTDLFNASKGIIIDIKTDAQGDFERACGNMDYYIQAMDQMVGAVESGKMEVVNEYWWFVITKEEPYFIDFYQLDLDKMLRVEESYWSTLHRLKNDLSGNPEKIVWKNNYSNIINPPNWYK